jgi:hypothetical protein
MSDGNWLSDLARQTIGLPEFIAVINIDGKPHKYCLLADVEHNLLNIAEFLCGNPQDQTVYGTRIVKIKNGYQILGRKPGWINGLFETQIHTVTKVSVELASSK